MKNRNVTLVHENEKAIYGEKGKDCLDLLKSVDSPKFRAAFDFGNLVQVGRESAGCVAADQTVRGAYSHQGRDRAKRTERCRQDRGTGTSRRSWWT